MSRARVAQDDPSNTEPLRPILLRFPFGEDLHAVTMVSHSRDEMVHASPAVSRRASTSCLGDKDWYDLDRGSFTLTCTVTASSSLRRAPCKPDYLTRHLLP